jgi:acyl-CoA oxidase
LVILQNAPHIIIFFQLSINGKNEDIHAFICQLQIVEGYVCLGIWIVECGHKIGLNGVDNGHI